MLRGKFVQQKKAPIIKHQCNEMSPVESSLPGSWLALGHPEVLSPCMLSQLHSSQQVGVFPRSESIMKMDDEGVGKERQPVEVEKKDLVPESEHHELEGAKDAAILHLRERDRQLQEMAELEAEMRRQREDRDRRRREAEEEDRARREMESIARREAERLAEAEREAKAREEQLLREADERERKEQEMREVEATLAQYLAQRRRGTEDDEGIVSAPAVGEDLAERSTEMSEHTAISANSSGLDDQAVPPLASSSAPQAASSSPSAAGLEDSTGAISIKSFGSDEAW
eukprot:tig00000383_g24653.t1